MRVDAQMDDKDLREKMRICKELTPIDFGIDADFAMMPLQKGGASAHRESTRGLMYT